MVIPETLGIDQKILQERMEVIDAESNIVGLRARVVLPPSRRYTGHQKLNVRLVHEQHHIKLREDRTDIVVAGTIQIADLRI